MNKLRGWVKSHTIMAFVLSVGILCAVLCGAGLLRAQSDNNLIAGFRRVEVASVSDALEQLTGRMHMSQRMHPLFTTKFAGFQGLRFNS
jgi:hypothetical protein